LDAVDRYLDEVLVGHGLRAGGRAWGQHRSRGCSDKRRANPGRKLLNPAGARRERSRGFGIGRLAVNSTIWLGRAWRRRANGDLGNQTPSMRRARAQTRACRPCAAGSKVRLGGRWIRLERLETEGAGNLNLVLIDADKPTFPADSSGRCASRTGSLLVVDNGVRDCAVMDAEEAPMR